MSIRDHRLKGIARRWGRGQMAVTDGHRQAWAHKKGKALAKRLRKSQPGIDPTISPSASPTIDPTSRPNADPVLEPGYIRQEGVESDHDHNRQ